MITSKANERVKQIRKLRERKNRNELGQFYIEGLRILGEAIQQNANIESIIVSPELLESSFGHNLVAEGRQKGIPVLEVSRDVFKSIALKEGPQGLAAIVNQAWTSLETTTLDSGDVWVALDSSQDPGNVGTIMRTLDAVGGKGLIMLDHTIDPYDPTCVRASMGSIFSLRLVRAAFGEFISWKVKHGYTLVGASGATELDYHNFAYPSPLVLLMGSERHGLSEVALGACDQVVRIPMVGRSDSLNLAMATGIILYEIFNQHRSIIKVV
jgi:TrmH family RNA methyltransferase